MTDRCERMIDAMGDRGDGKWEQPYRCWKPARETADGKALCFAHGRMARGLSGGGRMTKPPRVEAVASALWYRYGAPQVTWEEASETSRKDWLRDAERLLAVADAAAGGSETP